MVDVVVVVLDMVVVQFFVDLVVDPVVVIRVGFIIGSNVTLLMQ